MYFEEFSRFGLNWLTVSSAILISILVAQIKALYNQAIKVWSHRSGQSVSLEYFLFTLFLNFFAIPYGLKAGSLTIFLTGLTCPLFGWIVLGLWRFKETNKVQYSILAMGTVGVISLFWLSSEIILLTTGTLALIPLCLQIKDLLQQKDPGMLEVSYFATMESKFLVWFVYLLALGKLPLQILCLGFILATGSIILLWTYYHPSGKTALKKQILSLVPHLQKA